jgi:hypothetical protein
MDTTTQVTLPTADRTPGPVGISLFADDVTLSWRDMVVLMPTISDNTATDALLRRVGVDAVTPPRPDWGCSTPLWRAMSGRGWTGSDTTSAGAGGTI